MSWVHPPLCGSRQGFFVTTTAKMSNCKQWRASSTKTSPGASSTTTGLSVPTDYFSLAPSATIVVPSLLELMGAVQPTTTGLCVTSANKSCIYDSLCPDRTVTTDSPYPETFLILEEALELVQRMEFLQEGFHSPEINDGTSPSMSSSSSPSNGAAQQPSPAKRPRQ